MMTTTYYSRITGLGKQAAGGASLPQTATDVNIGVLSPRITGVAASPPPSARLRWLRACGAGGNYFYGGGTADEW